MLIYATSKNTGPSHQADPIHLLYLGTYIEEAVEAVGDFVKYEKGMAFYPKPFTRAYSALPRDIQQALIHFYAADGWWYSIVAFELWEIKRAKNS